VIYNTFIFSISSVFKDIKLNLLFSFFYLNTHQILYNMKVIKVIFFTFKLVQTFSNCDLLKAYSGNIRHNYLQYDMRRHVNTSPHLLHSLHLFDLLHAGDKVGGPDRGGARHGLLGSGLGFEGRLVGSQGGRRARRLVDQAHRGRVDCALC